MPADRTLQEGGGGRTIRALRVTVLAGPEQGLVKTSSETVTLGTAASNDVVLTDETVSRHHLELTRAGEEILLLDLGSTNGTLLSGARLERARVKPGVTLKLGRTQIRVDDGAELTLELHPSDRLLGMLGSSEGMRSLMARVERAARNDSPALILGETGSGKEVVARTLHQLSNRKAMPFEAVDCGSMLPTLLASELFGHEKGAFTGAEQRHIGAFERAAGGTIFLDEIGELAPALQVALLGVLERKSFRRLGGEETIPVDARVVCATHRDLRAGVNDGSFRADMYFRIAVVLLRVPPLRERKEDIPALVQHFAQQSGLHQRLEEIFPEQVMAELCSHRWPGNVRELRNTVESSVAMGEAPVIESFGAAAAAQPGDESPSEAGSPFKRFSAMPYPEAKEAATALFELHYLRDLLERTGGNVSKAAIEGQVHRTYLTRLLKRHGIRMRRTPEP